jgi:hypothetical protein
VYLPRPGFSWRIPQRRSRTPPLPRSNGKGLVSLFPDANTREWRIRCRVEVWIRASEDTAVIASGKHFRAVHDGDQHTIQRARSLLDAIRPDAPQDQIDRRVAHRPSSRMLIRSASKNTKARRASSSRFYHSATRSRDGIGDPDDQARRDLVRRHARNDPFLYLHVNRWISAGDVEVQSCLGTSLVRAFPESC